MSPSSSETPALSTVEPRLTEALGALTLEEKVLILTGQDLWSTWPLEKIGLRSMVVADGPSGVRGTVWDERDPSLSLPSATALSSSWDVHLAERYGAVAAVEARRKGVDVVLGPTINLHRSPLGGRHFEAFSEDPTLTGDLSAAYVRSLQDNGVGATPKHYVANDFETDRRTVDVQVSDRALRELYLLAFERSITESGAWMVMSAYNNVNGAPATENELLETPLNSEWGFDGVVVSDWSAVRSLSSARSSQDLVMPGPDGPWGEALVEAVRSGEIDEAVIDRKVQRLLLLAARVGALDGFDQPPVPAPVDGLAFAREAAAEGMVLVANDGILPLAPSEVTRLAVIGQNAIRARTQGGGSATVVPERVVSPLQGLTTAFGGDAEISFSLGAVAQEEVVELPPESMENPVTGGPGAQVTMIDSGGTEIFTEARFASALTYLGGDAPVDRAARVELATRWTPEFTGQARIGVTATGPARVFLDGEPTVELVVDPALITDGEGILDPPSATTPVEVVEGRAVDLRMVFEPIQRKGFEGVIRFTIGTRPAEADPEELIAQAAATAAQADVAVVVVGTSSAVESEGFDRTDITLPGQQDALVRAVAAANDRTVVVVNSGSPVLLPWRNEVAAVLFTYFGGQELGNALADVLTGEREPGGRLPTTWPVTMEDVPVLSVTPVDGAVPYDEGIHIGYRAWLRAGTEPAYPFGHGLGYTSWELGAPALTPEGESGHVVTVPVTNTGDRAGKTVIQVYAERPESAVDRPVRWLVGFSVARAEAGQQITVPVTVPRRALAHWDDGWIVEPGVFTLRVGTSVEDLPFSTDLGLDGR
jgi:beta-glucosidase